MTIARGHHWSAMALASVAVIDPQVRLPHRARPAVRVLSDADRDRDRVLRDRLASAGFTSGGDVEVATVATPAVALRALPTTPLDVVLGTGPDLSIERAVI